jgi:hypothetical protein
MRGNAICERMIGTLRREVLDRMLIVNEHHLRRVLTEYLLHYNTARPHRSLGQLAPAQADCQPPEPVDLANHRIRHKQVLGGLTCEYYIAALPARVATKTGQRPESYFRVPQGKTVRFPKGTCAACPLRARCTTGSNGRSVSVHPDEALLAELRQRQQSPDGRARLRERVAVEHALAHVGHWQGRRARYNGARKNLFDLRRVAVVHNLHVIARQDTTVYELAA